MQSFRPLTDRNALNVQPWRVDIVTLDRTMTPQEFVQRFPGPADAATIALLAYAAVAAPGIVEMHRAFQSVEP